MRTHLAHDPSALYAAAASKAVLGRALRDTMEEIEQLKLSLAAAEERLPRLQAACAALDSLVQG